MKTDYRLKHNRSFSYIYRKGRNTPSRNLAIMHVTARRLQVGLSVSKKVGNSVTRNLIKRRLREAVRSLLPLMENKYNFIIIARPSITRVKYQELCEELRSALRRAGLIKEE